MKRIAIALAVCLLMPVLQSGCSRQSSPRRTAKSFYEYCRENDLERVLLLVVPEERDECRSAFEEKGALSDEYRSDEYTVELDIDGDTAFFKIMVDRSPVPLGGHMKRINGKWWICQ